MSTISIPTPRRKVAFIALWVARVLTVLGWLTAVVGTILIAYVDVESVLSSGPSMVVLGALLLIAAAVCRNWFALGAGVSMVAVCLLFFGLVWYLDWSPSDAEKPFIAMSTIYTIALSPLAVVSLIQCPRITRYRPWECHNCGYPLYGLKTPTCPECGTSFNPQGIPPAPSKSHIQAKGAGALNELLP